MKQESKQREELSSWVKQTQVIRQAIASQKKKFDNLFKI